MIYLNLSTRRCGLALPLVHLGDGGEKSARFMELIKEALQEEKEWSSSLIVLSNYLNLSNGKSGLGLPLNLRSRRKKRMRFREGGLGLPSLHLTGLSLSCIPLIVLTRMSKRRECGLGLPLNLRSGREKGMRFRKLIKEIL
jgi:hypothetical protein